MSETPNIKKWKPMLDRILVKAYVDQKEDKILESGLVIPAYNTTDDDSTAAKLVEVISLGTGVKDEPFLCNEGDIVMCSRFAGSEVKIDDVDLLVIRNTDILMRYDKN